MLIDVCLGDTSCQCIVDGKPAPEATAASYASLMSYLRSPKCTSGYDYPPSICCGQNACYFQPSYVEVYYWPVEDANTSCLSIVGDSVNPWDYGATLTTNTGRCYWRGCAANMHQVQTYWGCKISSIVYTTATMTSINGFTFKSSIFNPWDTDNPCLATSSTIGAYTSNSSSLPELEVRPRALVKRPDSIGNITSPTVATVTLDGFTL